MLFCRWLNYKNEPMQKSIGGIGAQKLNLALNPPLRKTDVERKSLRASLSTDQALAGVQPFGTVL